MPKSAVLIINNNLKFNVPTQVSLFSFLNEKKIFLPSVCGGRGICGKCRCKVIEGGGSLQPAELKRLSQEDIYNRFRLACQVQIERDLKIEIPESILQTTEFEAQVALIRKLTYDIKLVRLNLIRPEEIHFKAGQFIQLKNNPYEHVQQTVLRSYSIASPAWLTKQIDLMIRLVPDGICSTWVHRHLQNGDRVTFIGPRGDFILRDGNEDIIMVAGGSGMAPMVSMVHELSQKTLNRKIVYFFGACKEKDLYYLDEMDAFKKNMPHFRFIPVLSQPENGNACEMETGLVTEPFQAYLQTIPTSKLQLYLCGSPAMIQNCKTIALQSGVPVENIFHDPFS